MILCLHVPKNSGGKYKSWTFMQMLIKMHFTLYLQFSMSLKSKLPQKHKIIII